MLKHSLDCKRMGWWLGDEPGRHCWQVERALDQESEALAMNLLCQLSPVHIEYDAVCHFAKCWG